MRRGKHEERKLSEKSEDKPMSTVTEIFGSMVFNDHVMKERLPKETYKAMQKTIRDGRRLDINVATVVEQLLNNLRESSNHDQILYPP